MSVQTFNYFDALISQSELLSSFFSPGEVASIYALVYNARLIALQKSINIVVDYHVQELLVAAIHDNPKFIYYIVYQLYLHVYMYPAYGTLSPQDIAYLIVNAPVVTSSSFIVYLTTQASGEAYSSATKYLNDTLQYYQGNLTQFHRRMRKQSNQVVSTIYKSMRDRAKL